MIKKAKSEKFNSQMEKLALSITKWLGTPWSLIVHTILFLGVPSLVLIGFDLRLVSILFTTWLSIEAIYLAIFIQMTVNRNTESLEEVEEDIEEIQEDVEGLEGDVEEISEEIEDIQAEDVKEDLEEAQAKDSLKNIEEDLEKLQNDISSLRDNLQVHQSSKKYLNG